MNKKNNAVIKAIAWFGIIVGVLQMMFVVKIVGSSLEYMDVEMMGLSILCLFLSSPFIIAGIYLIKRIKKNEERIEERTIIAQKIFQSCKELHLYSFELESSQDKLMNIANTYGIYTFEEAVNLFNMGKEQEINN